MKAETSAAFSSGVVSGHSGASGGGRVLGYHRWMDKKASGCQQGDRERQRERLHWDRAHVKPSICSFYKQAHFSIQSGISQASRNRPPRGTAPSADQTRQAKLVAASMQQPALMGRIALKVGLAHLPGEAVEQETAVPTILVTPENIDELEATLADTVFPVVADATPTT